MTTALDLANLLPTEPAVNGDALVVQVAKPLDMIWSPMTSGGAFVPAATAQGQGLVSGPGPGFLWEIGQSGLQEAPTDGATYGRNDAAWIAVLPIAGGTMQGVLTLGVNPTNPMDAATKLYADTKVARSGDTMSGPLILSADPTAALGAATKQYADLPIDCGTF